MEKQQTVSTGNELTLTNVIAAAIKLPGVKVNREQFLRQQFAKYSQEEIEHIVADGPVEAGCNQDELRHLASGLINNRTLMSTAASFATGLPGGLAMAATIPADMIQFYAVALRVAQEIVYLYGEKDIWNGSDLNMDMVTNQLILYCGVMLGAAGAASTVRIMSSALAKQMLKKLPQKALTKELYYRIIKSVAKAFGVKMTKGVFAKGVSKAIPILGGIVSGGITFASMMPMCNRLVEAMEKAQFAYTEEALECDITEIREICEAEETDKENKPEEQSVEQEKDSALDKLKKAKELLDCGAINEEEYENIKKKIIESM